MKIKMISGTIPTQVVDFPRIRDGKLNCEHEIGIGNVAVGRNLKA
jgi:hypothetical protein